MQVVSSEIPPHENVVVVDVVDVVANGGGDGEGGGDGDEDEHVLPVHEQLGDGQSNCVEYALHCTGVVVVVVVVANEHVFSVHEQLGDGQVNSVKYVLHCTGGVVVVV